MSPRSIIFAKTDGVVRGKFADAILHELHHGTPSTPERVAQIRRADEVYRTTVLRSTR